MSLPGAHFRHAACVAFGAQGLQKHCSGRVKMPVQQGRWRSRPPTPVEVGPPHPPPPRSTGPPTPAVPPSPGSATAQQHRTPLDLLVDAGAQQLEQRTHRSLAHRGAVGKVLVIGREQRRQDLPDQAAECAEEVPLLRQKVECLTRPGRTGPRRARPHPRLPVREVGPAMRRRRSRATRTSRRRPRAPRRRRTRSGPGAVPSAAGADAQDPVRTKSRCSSQQ